MGKVETLMARQGHMLEVMAVSQLEKRRQRLEESQVKARFAMAESYDRATMSQAPKAEAPAQDKNGTEPAKETQAEETKAEETGTKEQSVTTPSADKSAEENQNKGQDEK